MDSALERSCCWLFLIATTGDVFVAVAREVGMQSALGGGWAPSDVAEAQHRYRQLESNATRRCLHLDLHLFIRGVNVNNPNICLITLV